MGMAMTPTSARPVILGPNGQPYGAMEAQAYQDGARRAYHRALRAGYDAAQTTAENRRHWTAASAASANAELTPGVRRTLRNRARYETANSAYLKGIIRTLANYCVGIGPKLQFRSADKEVNRIVEYEFNRWARRVRLAAKLRTMRMAKAVDGEVFAMFTNNPRMGLPVQLDLALIEADRVTEPGPTLTPRANDDGILYDSAGYPTAYKVLKYHPGDMYSEPMSYDLIPADMMMHLYSAERPEQRRGVSEIAASLESFPHLRRYSAAVILAAEWAASMHGWLYSEQPPNSETAAEGQPWEEIEMTRNMLTVAPAGYKAMQMKAEQPVATHNDFMEGKLNECARPINMPLNIAQCNSSKYNYASGRLDHQTFFLAVSVDRADLEEICCDRIFEMWIQEAQMVPNYLPALGRYTHDIMWPGHPQADPEKEARAFDVRRRAGADTLRHWYAEQGRDADEELEVWADEIKKYPPYEKAEPVQQAEQDEAKKEA
jgi:capsid protein